MNSPSNFGQRCWTIVRALTILDNPNNPSVTEALDRRKYGEVKWRVYVHADCIDIHKQAKFRPQEPQRIKSLYLDTSIHKPRYRIRYDRKLAICCSVYGFQLNKEPVTAHVRQSDRLSGGLKRGRGEVYLCGCACSLPSSEYFPAASGSTLGLHKNFIMKSLGSQ